MSNHTSIILKYIDICERLSIEKADIETPKKLIVTSLRGVDNKQLYRIVFPDCDFIDWDKVDQFKCNCFGNVQSWLQFLEYIQVRVPTYEILHENELLQWLALTLIDVGVPIRHVNDKHTISRYMNMREGGDACVKSHMNQDEATNPNDKEPTVTEESTKKSDYRKLSEFWEDFIKMFLLMNISGIAGTQGAYAYIMRNNEPSGIINNVNQRCLEYSSKLADRRIPDEVLLNIHVFIVDKLIHLDGTRLMDEIDFFIADVALKRNDHVARMAVQTKMHRPRLRSILNANACIHGDVPGVGFSNWVKNVRFGASADLVQRQRVYFVCSQTDIDAWISELENFKGVDASIASQNLIPFPDPDIIAQAIRTLRFSSQFDALIKFRKDALHSLSGNVKNELTMNVLFWMYIAAYQQSHIWRECFIKIANIMFPILQRDIETFVMNNPIHLPEIKRAVLRGYTK